MGWQAGEVPLIELAAYYEWLPEESATKAAQAGDSAGRRWSEADWMRAANLTYLQTLIKVAWVGHRLKGNAPDYKPVSTPVYDRPPPTPEQEQRQAEHLQRVAALRRFSPAHADPPAEPPPTPPAGEEAPSPDP
ncbi:hypothetical protein ACFHW2_11815 [Actinomadura sp. LOL_016]|uniref:hypothetical protein n=1 Tax=unclassified Actinomadura TaxID=2626254 RepID=UPI003A7F7EF8